VNKLQERIATYRTGDKPFEKMAELKYLGKNPNR
jgi:hypothetical protein